MNAEEEMIKALRKSNNKFFEEWDNYIIQYLLEKVEENE